MKTPRTFEELLAYWDENEPPEKARGKGAKITRCRACDKWIREGKPYLVDTDGPKHIDCFLGNS